jgi:hypothetical protein
MSKIICFLENYTHLVHFYHVGGSRYAGMTKTTSHLTKFLV